MTGRGGYSRVEVERRYLLGGAPPALVGASGWRIVDRYIVGTRLRLRHMEALDGSVVGYKLGQKYGADGQSAAERTMTNFYLNEAEYATLAALEARTLAKVRYRYVYEGREYGIDVFEGPLRGLTLAETECESVAACRALQIPPFALRDVTEEPFFTGGHLATLTRERFEVGMTMYGLALQ